MQMDIIVETTDRQSNEILKRNLKSVENFTNSKTLINSNSMELSEDSKSFETLKKSLKELLTLKNAKNLVKMSLGYDPDVTDHLEFSIHPYSAEKLGYLSSHLRLDVKLLTGERISFFVKVVPYDVPTSAEYVTGRGVFREEAMFYGKMMPEMQRNYRGEAFAPKCFKVGKDFMVFEDLAGKLPRYSIREKLFDETLVLAGLSAIARLHAASLLAENRLGKTFDQLYPDAFKEKAFCRSGRAGQWFLAGEKLARKMAVDLGLNDKVIGISLEQVFRAVEKSKLKRNVVSHGDLWANNCMFSEEINPRCLLVDFQLLRYCAQGHDVAQFLFLCTSRKFRQANELRMLRSYQDTLVKVLEENSYPLDPPSWENLVLGYEEQKISAVATAVLYYPTILMDGKVSAKVMNDPRTYEHYYFNDRLPYVREIMDRDLTYRRRIEEAVEELVDLGSRLEQLPKPC